MIRPEDVTDAMVEVLHEKYDIAGRIGTPTKVAARIAIAAAINASGCVLVPPNTVALVMECRDALAEELAAWGINPPLHHVKQAYDRCEEWLAAADPREQALDRMAEDAREKGLYDEDKEKGDE